MNENINQPTYKRQRFLLAFIRQLQCGVTSTDLQKLVFLHTISEGLDFYGFIPYKYGPYSLQLAEDLDILRRDGYLSIECMKEGSRIKAVGECPKTAFFRKAKERGDALIRRAYREYPYYAINSEIIGRLFRNINHQQVFGQGDGSLVPGVDICHGRLRRVVIHLKRRTGRNGCSRLY